MAEEDNFDIDIYGDGQDGEVELGNEEYKQEEDHVVITETPKDNNEALEQVKVEMDPDTTTAGESQIPNSDGPTNSHTEYPKQAPQQQGVKRKETSDERPIDPGATSALLVSDLHWWTTEDDVRGWANQAGCEDELRDVSFSEHKVNGKSKGYVNGIQQQTCSG